MRLVLGNIVLSAVLLATVQSGCAEPAADEGDEASEALSEVATAEARKVAVLPGQAARRVVDEQLNEAENLFFTEDGRLFVSGAEDIFEIHQRPDGTFTKSDHFAENCIVEGIVERQGYLYGGCWRLGDPRTFLIAGELTADPVFKIIAPLESGGIPNGMTVDPEGRIYIADSLKNQIVRLTLGSPLKVARSEIWAANLPSVNGLKYVDGAIYATGLEITLQARFGRIPVLADGRAGAFESLLSRGVTVLDDIEPFEGGFIVTDFLKGTLLFWDAQRGLYAETPARTFYGPTSVALARGPMFGARQLIVAEKGNFLLRNESKGDLLSVYRLP